MLFKIQLISVFNFPEDFRGKTNHMYFKSRKRGNSEKGHGRIYVYIKMYFRRIWIEHCFYDNLDLPDQCLRRYFEVIATFDPCLYLENGQKGKKSKKINFE